MKRLKREFEGMKASPRTSIFGLIILVAVVVAILINPSLVSNPVVLLGLLKGVQSLLSADYNVSDEEEYKPWDKSPIILGVSDEDK